MRICRDENFWCMNELRDKRGGGRSNLCVGLKMVVFAGGVNVREVGGLHNRVLCVAVSHSRLCINL